MANNVGSPTGIVGIPNPTRRYTQWHIDEVYGVGEKPTNVNIVNVNDTVIDTLNQTIYLVKAVSKTGVPSLVPMNFKDVGGITEEDTILGTGPGLCSEGYRIYVNNKVLPHPCFIDCRVLITGSENTYIKIFKGSDISDKGTIVSGVFNSANRMVSENIPLENVVIPHYTNTNYKVAAPGHFTETLSDGEVVTVVVYNNAGHPTSQFRLLVVNTAFVRNIDASKKHITDITLVTPYLSASDRLQVEVPVGMVTQSASFMGKVTFSDGTTETYPVNGDKFALHGFDSYIASRVGDSLPIILRYILSPGEFSNIAQAVGNRTFINKEYRLKTIESDNRYNIKLFVIPTWNRPDNKWELQYWLYNLRRDTVLDVTKSVEYVSNSRAFDGREFGSAQSLRVSFNMQKLGSTYSFYNHVETFTITLIQPVTSTNVTTYYTLEYDSDSIIGTKAIAQITGTSNNYTIDLSNGAASPSTLIQAWYRNSGPLSYPFNESQAPDPTHVRVVIGSWSREIPVDSLLNPIKGVNTAIANGTSVQLEFIKASGVNRLQLGKTGLVAKLL